MLYAFYEMLKFFRDLRFVPLSLKKIIHILLFLLLMAFSWVYSLAIYSMDKTQVSTTFLSTIASSIQRSFWFCAGIARSIFLMSWRNLCFTKFFYQFENLKVIQSQYQLFLGLSHVLCKRCIFEKKTTASKKYLFFDIQRVMKSQNRTSLTQYLFFFRYENQALSIEGFKGSIQRGQTKT